MKNLVQQAKTLAGAITVIAGMTGPAFSTEYSMHAYLADPAKVAAAIGSNDAALQGRMLAMADFVKNNGLEERFTPPDQWKTAVADLIAGRPRFSADINPYAVQLLLLGIGKKADEEILMPFANLDIVADYLGARGDTKLAEFFRRLDEGNTDEGDAGLPAVLAGKLGPTEYHARMSVITPDDAAAFRSEIGKVAAAAAEIRALESDDETEAAKTARALIEKIEREDDLAFFNNPDNSGYLEGRTVEQAVAESVARTLEDPYEYTDALSSFQIDQDILTEWLNTSKETGETLFVVYASH